MSGVPLPLPDGGENPNPGADGSTRAFPARGRFHVSINSPMEKRIRRLAEDAGMSAAGWCRTVIEAAVVDAEADR